MIDWPISRIDSHEHDALERFTSQYKDAEALKGLTRVWAERIQGLEGAAYSTLTLRWVDGASGKQLDRMGAVVGEPRLGRQDPEYRDAIQLRISINQGSGEPETIIEFLRRTAGADQVRYAEIYPASIEVYAQGDVSVQNALRVRDIIPAGVGIVYLSESGGFIPFGYTETGIVPHFLETEDQEIYKFDTGESWEVLSFEPLLVDDVSGWGELGFHTLELDSGDAIELSSGDLLGVTDQSSPIMPTAGGMIAELFEV